jgi:type I restriction enzyme M protein
MVFDKGKPEPMRDKVLMIDARNIHRKVTRKIFDFTSEQQQNISSIVWLYRGQTDRFLALVQDYLEAAFTQMQACDFEGFEAALKAVTGAHRDEELHKLAATVTADIAALRASAKEVRVTHWDNAARDNDGLKASSAAFNPVADKAKALVKEIDHLYKLATRVHEVDIAAGTKPAEGKKRLNELDTARQEVTEHLKQARYFHTQAEWLQTRFPDADFCDVEGLVKLVGRDELKANDWSLTPGRYVGVAPEEEDEDFDFEEALRDIHIEIDGLNAEAADLAATIKKNFEELIV